MLESIQQKVTDLLTFIISKYYIMNQFLRICLKSVSNSVTNYKFAGHKYNDNLIIFRKNNN